MPSPADRDDLVEAFAAMDAKTSTTVPPSPSSSQWPSSLSAAAFHGALGDVVQTLDPETEADPAGMLLQMLAMLGSSIGRGPHFTVGADAHYLNLFVGIVGESAKGRKGVSRGQAQRLFEGADPDWVNACITSGLSSGEGLIWAIRDPIEKQQPVKDGGRVVDYQVVVEDAGVTDKRLLVVETELAATLKVMGREGNTLSPVIRQAWDGHDLRTLTKTSSAKATAPHIAIIGHITRDELRRYLDATESANGFGNRFLWVCVRRSKLLPDGGRDVDLTSHVASLRAAVEHARVVGEVRRDRAASQLWHAVYERLSAGRPGMFGAMTGRAEAQVMRLACLYAVADRSLVVGRPHLEAALAVWRYCSQSAAYLFGSRLGDPSADEILRALRDCYPESLSRKEILHDVFHRNRTAAEISRALGLLAENHLARCEQDRTGEGRPAERWFAILADDLNDFNDLTPPGKQVKVVKVVKVVGRKGDCDADDAL